MPTSANVPDASGVEESLRWFRHEARPGDGVLATGSHQVAALAVVALPR